VNDDGELDKQADEETKEKGAVETGTRDEETKERGDVELSNENDERE
jgi:hypothetical protein